jgi:hypothetical protein
MSGISTNIPGTNYQLRGDQFIGQDGTTLTREQFVDKVSKKEITLTGESLKFLDKQLGPDTMNSLRTGAGFPSSPQALNGKLDNQTTKQISTDLYALLAFLERVNKDNEKTTKDGKHIASESRFELMAQSAKKELEAGNWKAAMGIVQGLFTMAAGGALSQGNKAGGKMLDGLSSLVAAGFQFGINDVEKQGKDLGLQSQKSEVMAEESNDLLKAIRDMHDKVKELLQAIQQAESQTARNVNSM